MKTNFSTFYKDFYIHLLYFLKSDKKPKFKNFKKQNINKKPISKFDSVLFHEA